MSSFDDEGGEMRDFEDLLAGLIGPDEAPPALREVARLVQAARSPATSDELAGGELLAAQVAAVVRQAPLPGRNASPWRRRVVRLASVKVAGVAAAILLGGGVAAAATGSLPAPVQRVVARSLHHIGVSIPLPSPKTTVPPATSHGRAVAARPAALCLAYHHRPGSLSSVGLEELRRLAGASGEGVGAYCAAVLPGRHYLPPTTTSSTMAVPGSSAPGRKESSGSAGSSKGHGKSGGEGHPPTTTPHGPVVPGSSAGHHHGKKNKAPGGGAGDQPGKGTGAGKANGNGSNPGQGGGGGSNPGKGSGSKGGGASNPGSGTAATTGGSDHGTGGNGGSSAGGSPRGGHLVGIGRALAGREGRVLAGLAAEIGSIGTSVGKGA